MAQNVAAIRKGLASGLIPDTILKQIGDQEVLDRLAEAGRLTQQANGLSGRARADLLQQARAVMQAQPRAVTEREVQAAVAKAAALGNGHQADAMRRHARGLLDADPPAPRRQAAPVAKAGKRAPVRLVYNRTGRACCVDPAKIRAQIRKADGDDGKPGPVAVYDAKGDLVGVCDADDITLVTGADAPAANEAEPAQPAPAPGQASAPDEVAKARRAAQRRGAPQAGMGQVRKAFREGWLASQARQGRR